MPSRTRNPLKKLLDAAQARFRRARPGSVLIMVVSLLVLLALIATAAMTSARVDRFGSRQHVYSTQIDLMLEGARNMLMGAFYTDALSRGRNPSDGPGSVTEQGMSLDARRDAIVGSRLPERLMKYDYSNPIDPRVDGRLPNLAASDPIAWRYISYPPFVGPNGTYVFNPPTVDTINNTLAYDLPKNVAFAPTWIQLQNGDFMPALQPLDMQGNPSRNPLTGQQIGPFHAADADGDGIADSLLYKMPGGTNDGVTYYIALRVFDNNSAVNVNTSWRWTRTSDRNVPFSQVENLRPMNGEKIGRNNPRALMSVPFTGIFPSDIDLTGFLLDPVNEMAELNRRRLGGSPTGNTATSEGNLGITAYDDSGTVRADFEFLTAGDLLWHQLGRRLAFPGAAEIGGAARRLGYAGTRPWGVGDSVNLAYRYMLRPPDSTSPLETNLQTSLGNAQTTPFEFVNYPGRTAAQQITLNETNLRNVAWFGRNFDYSYTSPQSVRPLLTAYNPVGNQVFPHVPQFSGGSNLWEVVPWPNLFLDQLLGPTTDDPLNDAIQAPPNSPPSSPGRREVALNMYPQFNPYETKAGLNTAGFSELWSAFYDIMCDDRFPNVPEFDDIEKDYDGTASLNPFYGSAFTNAGNAGKAPAIEAHHPARMFRSPLRPAVSDFNDVGHNRLTPFHMMMIRSAIAAANLIDMRDVDNDVTMYRLRFGSARTEQPNTAGAALSNRSHMYEVMIFGTERQPFITEVYLNNNTHEIDVPIAPGLPPSVRKKNHSGFTAIELYNPYDTPISLANWRIRLINRPNWTNTVTRPNQPRYFLNFLTNNTDSGRDQQGNNDTNISDSRINDNVSNAQEFQFGTDAIIPARGHMVLWNFDRNAANTELDAASYLPGGIGERTQSNAPGGLKYVFIKELHKVHGKEFVLMRPLVENIQTPDPTLPAVVPVDSFDATGFSHRKHDPNIVDTDILANVHAWHYCRASDEANGKAWQFVYPGRYDGSMLPNGTNTTDATRHDHGPLIQRHQGIHHLTWNPKSTNTGLAREPWETLGPNPAINFGEPNRLNSREGNDESEYDPSDVALGNPWGFAIQILNHQMPGPFSPNARDETDQANSAPKFRFPLGGFARVGDVLSVPYIGAYYVFDVKFGQVPGTDLGIFNTGNVNFIECNSITMDAVFAEDTDLVDDPFEDIGRFTPIQYELDTPPRDAVDFGTLRGVGAMSNILSRSEFEDSLRRENNDEWVGYQVYVYNPGYVPNSTNPNTRWKRQIRTVQTYTYDRNKLLGTFKVSADFKPELTSGVLYPYELKRSRYSWAADVLDYFTAIHGNGNDFQPNINVGARWPTNPPSSPMNPSRFHSQSSQTSGIFLSTQEPADYEYRDGNDDFQNTPPRPAPILPVQVTPKPVMNTTSPPINRQAMPFEDKVPTEGLININTASAEVLSRLPMVIDWSNNGLVMPDANYALAKRIVYFRDVDDGRGWLDPVTNRRIPHPHGAFKNIMELNMVPGFRTATDFIGRQDMIDVAGPHPDNDSDLSNNPGPWHGDFSPFNKMPDGDRIRGDFEEKYLAVNRISNLITTRSDTFTCYLLVQGWRDADSSNATLVSQRRAAFILDRSRLLKSTDRPAVYNIPSN